MLLHVHHTISKYSTWATSWINFLLHLFLYMYTSTYTVLYIHVYVHVHMYALYISGKCVLSCNQMLWPFRPPSPDQEALSAVSTAQRWVLAVLHAQLLFRFCMVCGLMMCIVYCRQLMIPCGLCCTNVLTNYIIQANNYNYYDVCAALYVVLKTPAVCPWEPKPRREWATTSRA